MTSAATTRNLVAPLLRWGYRLHLSGGHHCPRQGPVLVVAQHEGFLDATLLAAALPRPVVVLVDRGALAGATARIPGRIAVDPDDPGEALRRAAALLAGGSALGAWSGDGHELAAGYVLARSPAPVLPVALIGGGGHHPGDPPPWRSRIAIVVGEPFEVAAPRDPMSRAGVLLVAEAIRQRVADHARAAIVRTGRLDGVALERDGRAADNGAL